MRDEQVAAPEHTAVRTALWRAMHVEVDSPPHVSENQVGSKLVVPDDGWRNRPYMSSPTRPFRSSIVARARFIEDVVAEQAAHGVGRYVILGAGLDAFAQRRPELASDLLVFEVDQPGPQAWTATSRTGQTASARQTIQRNCWWLLRSSRSVA
jgi:O-methyltransferase involved in polyketide biosynthesis